MDSYSATPGSSSSNKRLVTTTTHPSPLAACCPKADTQRESDMGTHTHPANNLIQAEVDLFMHTHSKVRSGDVAGLEIAVRRATREERKYHHHHYPATSRSSPRPTTAHSGTPASKGGSSISHRSSSSHCGKCRSLISVSSQEHGGFPGDMLASSARMDHHPGVLSGRPRP
ncbi:unnamed protein product, partial [Laminaria digitata]